MVKYVKRYQELDLRERIIGSIIFGLFTVAILFIIIEQMIEFGLLDDIFIYLHLLIVIGWYAFNFALIFWISRLLPKRAAKVVTTVIAPVLLSFVGFTGSALLGRSFGYSGFLSSFIYIFVPCLLTFLVFTIYSLKSKSRTRNTNSGKGLNSLL